MVRFFWCHTEGCPNYGRARQLVVAVDQRCPSCGATMKLAEPEEEK